MSLSLPSSLMVSVSGFRGRVGDPLTPELIAAIAAGFGAFLRQGAESRTVLLGRDSRTSGAMFAAAASAGLRSVGCDVVDLGIVPTPTLMLAVRESKEAIGGLGITASHNPAEWNALKLAGPDGTFLDGERSAAFQRYLREKAPPRARWDDLGTIRADEDAIARHRGRILDLPLLDIEGLRARRFHVALDCVRGAGGRIMPALLESLGCVVSGVHLEPDGLFPRDPEPTAASLAEFGEFVRESGADLGFAVDPDVDRLSLVDREGRPLGEDMTLALAAAVVLRRSPGATVVTNLSTSRVVEDVADHFEGKLLRAPVGEINVARRMQEAGAVVGGEGNGGVILPALHLTRDAPVGAALILQHLLDTGSGLREAADRWPQYAIVKEKVEFPRESLAEAYAALGEMWSQAGTDRTDGLRLEWGEERSWLHLRPSGTEPVVRVIAEAPDGKNAMTLVREARSVLSRISRG